MKKYLIIFLLAFGALTVLSQEAQAQRYDEAQYNYADVSSGIIYQLYIKFNGYQVQVWMKNNRSKDWSACSITKTTDDVISFKLGTTQYHMKLDPRNEDVVVLYNANYSKSWRYLKQ